MNETAKRNYSKEYENAKNKNKIYSVKIPKYLSIPLDEKLERENKTFSSLVKEAIEKYLKK
jgi:predicted DNA-binding protein